MSLNDVIAAKDAYYEAREAKGQMGGSDAGFWISFYGDY